MVAATWPQCSHVDSKARAPGLRRVSDKSSTEADATVGTMYCDQTRITHMYFPCYVWLCLIAVRSQQVSQGFIQRGGALGFPPPPRISELYYDISIDLMQVPGL